MKKVLLAVAATMALNASASAQQPVVATSNCNQCAQPTAGPVVSTGFATPSFGRKIGFFGIFGGSGKVPPPPPAMGGQLVFPQHPFVRSPRDFFMQ